MIAVADSSSTYSIFSMLTNDKPKMIYSIELRKTSRVSQNELNSSACAGSSDSQNLERNSENRIPQMTDAIAPEKCSASQRLYERDTVSRLMNILRYGCLL